MTPERSCSAVGRSLPIADGVRRWQVVLLVLLVLLAGAVFLLVKFFEFVGSQN
jgi:hypothetical protein